MLLMDKNEVEPDTHTVGHGEVRKSGDNGDHRSDGMVDASGLGIVSQIGSFEKEQYSRVVQAKPFR